jgi:hypothetical protein
MTQCDPTPGAPATCPGGYHCTEDGVCDAVCSQAGMECGDGYRCTPDGRCVGNDDCIGLECKIKDCAKDGKPLTTISGTVFAPNGTLPLYGIQVYVPNVPVGPPQDGAVCDRCTDSIPGYPIALTKTDENGRFSLVNVPSGTEVPVIIQSGKWRRELKVPTVAECADTPLAPTETRLPKNKSEGFMPRIAISTGNADSLECLVRKLGIDDAELGTAGDDKRLHLYADTGSPGQGANKFKAGFPGGSGNFANSTTLWNTVPTLKPYDIVILSCEGNQYPETKSQAAMDALKAYADLGGRVFLSHWHNIWIEGSTQGGGNQAPAVWTDVATWSNGGNLANGTIDVIDEVSNPNGMSFATWMLNVQGSTVRGEVVVNEGRTTAMQVNPGRGERWTYVKGGSMSTQNFQFTTPNEVTPDNRCGKVVFSDMHVSGDSDSQPGTPFPDGCATSALTPQEKALAFMFFDIASCVQPPLL